MLEYRVEPYYTGCLSGALNPKKLASVLNGFSEDGWRFVRSIHEVSRIFLFFSRESHFLIFEREGKSQLKSSNEVATDFWDFNPDEIVRDLELIRKTRVIRMDSFSGKRLFEVDLRPGIRFGIARKSVNNETYIISDNNIFLISTDKMMKNSKQTSLVQERRESAPVGNPSDDKGTSDGDDIESESSVSKFLPVVVAFETELERIFRDEKDLRDQILTGDRKPLVGVLSRVCAACGFSVEEYRAALNSDQSLNRLQKEVLSRLGIA